MRRERKEKSISFSRKTLALAILAIILTLCIFIFFFQIKMERSGELENKANETSTEINITLPHEEEVSEKTSSEPIIVRRAGRIEIIS